MTQEKTPPTAPAKGTLKERLTGFARRRKYALGAVALVLLLATTTVSALAVAPLTRIDVAQVEAVYYDAHTGEPIIASNEHLAALANETHASPTLFATNRP